MQLSAVNRSVADRLHSAAIRLLRRLRRHDEAMGLTAARASALSVLVFGGRAMTLGALAQAEQVSAPTVTRLIVGMERDGLVRREADAGDGRVAWLHPTAKGTRLLHAGRTRDARRRRRHPRAHGEQVGRDQPHTQGEWHGEESLMRMVLATMLALV